MINIPITTDPNFQAFICGFMLPFLAAAFGFTISIVRHILENVDRAN